MTTRRRAAGTREPTRVGLGIQDALVQLSFAVQGVLQRVADAHDLSIVQVRLLGILRDREAGMLELSKLLGIDKSSVTGLVDRAERRDLVERRATAEDGRAVRVALTARGRELVRTVGKRVERDVAELVASLDAGERADLAGLATRVVVEDLKRRLPGASVM